MEMMDVFQGWDKDVERFTKRQKKQVNSECPENEKLPQEWRNKSSLEKLIILRALRPDRMTYALGYEIWGYVFQGKCVWGWLVRVSAEKTQILRQANNL